MEHKPDCASNLICTTVHKGGQTCLYKGCDCGAEGIPFKKEELPPDEISVTGELLGFKYGMRAPLSTPALSSEQMIRSLLSALKNSMLLRLKYPEDTNAELDARMEKGDLVTRIKMII